MNENQACVEWDTRFMLGIPLIDRQHEKLVQLTNSLYMACLHSKEKANRGFIAAVHEAVDYVCYHFTTEEKIMLLTEFPEYLNHKKEHESFVREILNRTQKFTDKNHLIPNRFVYFLKDWILSHIAVCDKVLAEHILGLKHHEKLMQLFPHSA